MNPGESAPVPPRNPEEGRGEPSPSTADPGESTPVRTVAKEKSPGGPPPTTTTPRNTTHSPSRNDQVQKTATPPSAKLSDGAGTAPSNKLVHVDAAGPADEPDTLAQRETGPGESPPAQTSTPPASTNPQASSRNLSVARSADELLDEEVALEMPSAATLPGSPSATIGPKEAGRPVLGPSRSVPLVSRVARTPSLSTRGIDDIPRGIDGRLASVEAKLGKLVQVVEELSSTVHNAISKNAFQEPARVSIPTSSNSSGVEDELPVEVEYDGPTNLEVPTNVLEGAGGKYYKLTNDETKEYVGAPRPLITSLGLSSNRFMKLSA